MNDASAPWQRDVDLQARNSLRLPARAEYFFASGDAAALGDAVARAEALGMPWRVLGGGTNAVLMSRLPGLTVHPQAATLSVSDAGLVRAGAALSWSELVDDTVEAGWWGIENLALIPGQVGAAPIQNIGAYGVELAEVCTAVRVLDLQAGDVLELPRAACGFGYRDSVFRRQPGRYLVLELVLQLQREGRLRLDYPELADVWQAAGGGETPVRVAAAVKTLRRRKLPDVRRSPNAGSFFKNPSLDAVQARRLLEQLPEAPLREQHDGYKLSAAWLIEHCGLRGHREGAFEVSAQHALVLVHHGGGTGEALLAFARAIRLRVQESSGIELEMEPRVLGAEH